MNIPDYWVRSQQILSAERGQHRFLFDMKYMPLYSLPSFPIAAIYENTAPDPTSPWLMPGKYMARLTVDGKIYEQTIEIMMDPRIKISRSDLQKQHDLSILCYQNRKKCMNTLAEIHQFRSMLQSQLTSAEIRAAEKLSPLEKEAALLEITPQGSANASFSKLNNNFASLFNTLQECDAAPTTQVISAVMEAQKQLDALIIKWNLLKTKK